MTDRSRKRDDMRVTAALISRPTCSTDNRMRAAVRLRAWGDEDLIDMLGLGADLVEADRLISSSGGGR